MIDILNSLWDSDLSMPKLSGQVFFAIVFISRTNEKDVGLHMGKELCKHCDRDSLSCFDTNVYLLSAHTVIEDKQIQSYTLAQLHIVSKYSD